MKKLFEEGTDDKRYGITVTSENESVSICDITTVFEKAYEIYELLIKNFVSPIHTKYIITDMIS